MCVHACARVYTHTHTHMPGIQPQTHHTYTHTHTCLGFSLGLVQALIYQFTLSQVKMGCLFWAELFVKVRVVFVVMKHFLVVMKHFHISDLFVFVLRAGEDERCGRGIHFWCCWCAA